MFPRKGVYQEPGKYVYSRFHRPNPNTREDATKEEEEEAEGTGSNQDKQAPNLLSNSTRCVIPSSSSNFNLTKSQVFSGLHNLQRRDEYCLVTIVSNGLYQHQSRRLARPQFISAFPLERLASRGCNDIQGDVRGMSIISFSVPYFPFVVRSVVGMYYVNISGA